MIGPGATRELKLNKPLQEVRVGLVGAGNMGTNHVRSLARIPGAVVAAICDADEANAEQARGIVTEAGHPAPTLYTRGERDFERLCGQEDLDLVYATNPWEWHTAVCVTAMNHDKHAATEVPAAVTLEECWQLVETAERTGRQCIILENCCYDRVELMVLNLVRRGLLGDLVHAECGYMHDLRNEKLPDARTTPWRTQHSIRRNEDLYPTHGVGPVAQCMNVNRGNRFSHLVSMSTGSKGLNLFAAAKFGSDHPHATRTYAVGDVVTTLIRTTAGQTVVVKHDTNSPRPYSRDYFVQGTRGVVRKYPEEKIHIEGRSETKKWESLEGYAGEFAHPLWERLANQDSMDLGHGLMDYLVDYRVIQCLRAGGSPDIDVYDAATWSAISALSGQSIADGSRPIAFPDFTRGRWKVRPPLGIVS